MNTETFSKSGFAIYPNPVRDVLRFSGLESREISEGKVYDVLGKAVSGIMFDRGNGTMNVERLPTGIYFIKVMLRDGGFFNKRFMKI